jgi:hypothetical protein
MTWLHDYNTSKAVDGRGFRTVGNVSRIKDYDRHRIMMLTADVAALQTQPDGAVCVFE